MTNTTWKPHAIGAEGSTHLETVDSETLFVTRVRSEGIWPECAAQRERKAQLQVGAAMAENSHSRRTHWKVKHTPQQVSKKRTLYSL